MTKTLHDISLDASKYTSGWISRQPTVKEESITDWLLDYFDQNSSDISYYQFTRHEEAKYSGADWDWWVILPESKGCFKIRVQAKRLRQGHDHYSDITRSNKHGFQIDTLLKSSAILNFYPIYANYTLSEGVERCQRTPPTESLFISSALDIYNLVFGTPRFKLESTDILKLCIPMPCLFGCPLTSRNGKYRCGITALFQNYFDDEPDCVENSESSKSDLDRGYEKEVPYIIELMSNTDNIDLDRESIEIKYKEQYAGSNAVAIFKISNKHIG
ncbi:MAG: DUF6615 family protein [Sedimenticola sp.]